MAYTCCECVHGCRSRTLRMAYTGCAPVHVRRSRTLRIAYIRCAAVHVRRSRTLRMACTCCAAVHVHISVVGVSTGFVFGRQVALGKPPCSCHPSMIAWHLFGTVVCDCCCEMEVCYAHSVCLEQNAAVVSCIAFRQLVGSSPSPSLLSRVRFRYRFMALAFTLSVSGRSREIRSGYGIEDRRGN